jgi:hypothetical protein
LSDLNVFSKQVAKAFQRRYPSIKELGIDIAVDKSLFPWIIEVNTRPVIKLFNGLKDKRMLEEYKATENNRISPSPK